MFNNCLTGELKDKTRILVTNQLQFVSPADIAIFMANGKISEIGTYAELMANGDQFASLMSQAEVPACSQPFSILYLPHKLPSDLARNLIAPKLAGCFGCPSCNSGLW